MPADRPTAAHKIVPGALSPVVRNPDTSSADRKVAGWSYVTAAFPPPANPFKARASVWHAVHWNKLREMARPYGFAEVEGSAVILGDGQGSVITFRVKGEPRWPESIQTWLKTSDPKGWDVGVKIAKGAAGVIGLIAKLLKVPALGAIAAGAVVVIDAVVDVVDDVD